MGYIPQDDHHRRLLTAAFDWPPTPSLGRNLGPRSVTAPSQTLCPGSSNYAQLHVFHRDEGGGAGWRRRG